MAKVTIFTPTYNKPELFSQAAESVLAQTYQDWVWWVVYNTTDWPAGYCHDQGDQWNDPRYVPIWFPADESVRYKRYIPSAITNWLYPKIQTPYIYVLCDDDLIDKDGLGVLVDTIRNWELQVGCADSPAEAVYGRVEVQNEQPDGTFTTSCWCYEGTDVGLGTGISPDCRLDSGSILHTKALWDKATADGWRMPTALDSAPHVDGILLDRLAQFATFHYVPQRIAIHRRTRQSTWHKPQGT